MQTTDLSDAVTVTPDAPLRLRTEVIDALMLAKGIKGKAAQAREFGVNRQHWFDLRTGEVLPNLKLALKIAQTAGTTVEAIWGPR